MRPLARLRGSLPRILSACPMPRVRQIIIVHLLLDLLPQRRRWPLALLVLPARLLLLSALLRAAEQQRARGFIHRMAAYLSRRDNVRPAP